MSNWSYTRIGAKDGKGIQSITEYYKLSVNTTEIFSASTISTWSTSISQPTSAKPYLLNAELVVYSDGTNEYKTPHVASRYVTDGQAGRGIAGITEYYLATSASSEVTRSTSGWTTTIQTMTSTKKYLWNYEKTTYTDDSDPSYTNPCIIGVYGDKGDKGDQGERGLQGIQGPQGEQGIPGTNGTNGKTSYFHIKYSSKANPTAAADMTETPSEYIGTYVDYTSSDSTDPSKYTWARFKGVQGEQGEQGIPGTNGADGQTYYLHIAYATNSAGTSGFSTTSSANKTYIGQYTDTNATDSTDPTKYKWTKIKGDAGASFYSYVRYSANADGTDFTATPSSSTKYVGFYSGSSSTAPTDKASYTWTKFVGEDGANGTSLTSKGNWASGTAYKVSEVVYYTTNKTSYVCKKAHTASSSILPTNTTYWTVLAASGTDGQDATQYYMHFVYCDDTSSGTNYSTTESRKYVGIYTDTTQEDAATFSAANAKSGIIWSKAEGDTGSKGDTGTRGSVWYSGTGITGTSTTATVFSGSGVSSALVGDMYKNTSTNYTYRCTVAGNASTAKWVYTGNLTGAKGDKGDQGERGLQGIQGPQGEQGIPGTNGTNGKTSYFHIKYSSKANPTATADMTETPSEYIGTYVDYTSSDSTDPSKYTWARFKGVQGEQGEQGIPGTNGADGQTYYLHIAYATNSTGTSGFSTTSSANKTYIGQYTDTNATDSTDPTKYKWTKIKGDAGANSYSYVRYSANADGTDFTTTPSSSTKYVGFYSGSSSTAPTEKTAYTWSKYVGDNGGNGTSTRYTSASVTSSTTSIALNTLTGSTAIVGDMIIGNSLLFAVTAISGSNATVAYKQSLKGEDNKAISVILSAPNVSVPSATDGTSPTLSSTSTTVRVYQNTTELAYDGSGTTNGTWKMTVAVSGCTGASITDSGTYATLENITAMSANSATRTMTITGKRNDGTSFTTTVTQTLSKNKKGEQGTRGNLTFSGTEIYAIRASAVAYTLTTASTGITSNTMSILVGDKYINSLTFDVWKCTTAGTASTAKWTYEGRQADDKDNSNIWRFFGDGTRNKYNGGSIGAGLTVTTELGTDPFGGTSELLKVTRATSTSAVSGYVTPYGKTTKIESGFNYRYVCYVKKTAANVKSYFGIQNWKNSSGGYNPYVLSLGGDNINSAYCASATNFGTLNRWYCIVAYITANGVTTAPNDSGIYDMVTKTKVANCTNFQFKNITEVPHDGTLLLYLSNQTATADTAYIYDIRFDKCDGTEPSLDELLNGNFSNGSRAPRYLGSVAQSNPTTTNPTFSGVTTINGDWYLNTSDGKVYLRTANNAWTAQSTTTPNQYHLACINDMVSLLGTTTDATVKSNLETICNAYVERLLVGTAFINYLQTKQLTLSSNGKIQSADYVSTSGAEGFKIDANGKAEFNGGSITIDDMRIVYDDTKHNMSFGKGAGESLTTGQHNLLIGTGAGASTTTGKYNTIIGDYAAFEATNTSETGHNVVVGQSAFLKNTSGNMNIAIGGNTLMANTTGSQNVAIGVQALKENIADYDNIAIGVQALYAAKTPGVYNIAIGYRALGYSSEHATLLQQNIGIGNLTAPHLTDNATGNIFIGENAGAFFLSGDNNLCIGKNTSLYLTNGYKQVNINDRLVYIEFKSTTIQETVFNALNSICGFGSASYASCGAMGRAGTDTSSETHGISVVKKDSTTRIKCLNYNGTTYLTVNKGNYSAIGVDLQVWVVPMKAPENYDFGITAGTYTPSAFYTMVTKFVAEGSSRSLASTPTITVNGQSITPDIIGLRKVQSGNSNNYIVYFRASKANVDLNAIVSSFSTNASYVTYVNNVPSTTTDKYANYNITLSSDLRFA